MQYLIDTFDPIAGPFVEHVQLTLIALAIALAIAVPLALPLILAGVRLATLSIIAIGTVAALVGAGGLGTPLLIGVTTGDTRKIVAGSIAVAVLAFGANAILRWLERRAALAVRGDD